MANTKSETGKIQSKEDKPKSEKKIIENYTADQLKERVADLKDFTHIPHGFWLIGIRSKADKYNEYDDIFYLFKSSKLVNKCKGTTNAGSKGLKEFHEYNPDGVAVLKSDTIIYDSHKRGVSKGRTVYRQNKPWPFYRDNNYDNKNDEKGKVESRIICAHVHDISYLEDRSIEKQFINGDSLACQVFAKGKDYDKFMELTKDQRYLTYCLLKEF